MTKTASDQTKPLSGIRVLSLEHIRSGPTASVLLADAGAEVIKIEPPGSGEAGRGLFVTDKHGRRAPFMLLALSRNKKSLTLNLRSDKGKEMFKQLVKQSDIVLENMRPHVLDRLGVGYSVLKEVNPRIVYVSISGFGHQDIYKSPYSDWPAFDYVAQALSGYTYTAGRDEDPPLLSNAVPADTVPSFLAAFGALAALRMRDQTGQGQHVDTAMYDSMVLLNNHTVTYASLFGEKWPKRGKFISSAPGDAYKASDGYFIVGVVGEPMWKRFCQTIGREDLIDLPELKDGNSRSKNEEAILTPIISEWAKNRTVEESCRLFMENDVPAVPVQDELELLSCPHLKARNMLVEIDDPDAGRATVAGNPVKFSAAPEEKSSPSPKIGEHTSEILEEELGLSRAELDILQKEGVI